MKDTDLRIGNLIGFIPRENKIHIPVTWIPHKVVSVEIGKVKTIFPHENLAHIGKPMEFLYSDIVGIPLTEEWLVKFGFRKQDADHIYLFPKNDSLRMWGFAWSVQNWVFPHEWIDINTPSIQYVHQLQNLYFALTGTELEIK